jgi:hypothetical protein
MIRKIRPSQKSGRAAAVFLLFAVLLLAVPGICPAAGKAAGRSDKVCNAYMDQKYDEALKLAKEIVSSPSAEAPEKVDAYKCQTCVYVAQRKVPPAKRSIGDMLTVDPTARFSPDYQYPPPVIDLYNVVRDSLAPQGGGTVDIHTVAVGDFEDNSVYKGKFKNYDFSLFRLALVHTVMADLAEATPLKLVDRQRTDQIVKEIQLGQSGFQNPAEAVRFGQMLGAQTFIFGQFMILSKDEVRIDARVVETATGEVILARQVTGNFGGNPKKFLSLEHDLVQALADGIGKVLAGGGDKTPIGSMAASYFDQQKSGISSRKGYVESKFLIAEALEQEDQGNYDKARGLWQKAAEMDPTSQPAKERVAALASMEK